VRALLASALLLASCGNAQPIGYQPHKAVQSFDPLRNGGPWNQSCVGGDEKPGRCETVKDAEVDVWFLLEHISDGRVIETEPLGVFLSLSDCSQQALHTHLFFGNASLDGKLKATPMSGYVYCHKQKVTVR
jgi:hypothetical protein